LDPLTLELRLPPRLTEPPVPGVLTPLTALLVYVLRPVLRPDDLRVDTAGAEGVGVGDREAALDEAGVDILDRLPEVGVSDLCSS